MTPEELDDSAARPSAPQFNLTPLQEIHGKRLGMIHRMYRQELAAVARLMADIRAGVAKPQTLPPAIAGLTLTENLSLFGTVCGRECAILQNHHDIEEQWMFPALSEKQNAELQVVLDRLIAEHKVIHALIGDLREVADRLADEMSEPLSPIVRWLFSGSTGPCVRISVMKRLNWQGPLAPTKFRSSPAFPARTRC